MFRTLILAILAATLPAGLSGQTSSVLHITVTLTDAAGTSAPIPRHALLISEDPVSSAPRSVVTGSDGTVDVTLLPGRYIVESDRPVAFGGKGYEWTQRVVLPAGRTVVLELTIHNAESGVAPVSAPAGPYPSTPQPDDATVLLSRWTDSVVAIWTPTSRASGFIVDTSGLVVTNQRVVGTVSALEVQLEAGVKVPARVLMADQARDVAVLLIDPSVIASVRPLRFDCATESPAMLTRGQTLLAIGAPMRGPHEVSAGEVIDIVGPEAIADLSVAPGTTGGPVFSTAGTLVGLSSFAEGGDQMRGRNARIVAAGEACAVVSAAQKASPAVAAPAAVHLPVELAKPFPAGVLESAVRSRGGRVSPYTMSTSDFDVAFLTPVVIHAAQHAPAQANGRAGPGDLQAQPRPLVDPTDFGGWSDYFEDGPPVLVIRVTPKFEEGFWTKFARGAASTQGIALPPIKRFKPGFSGLRVFCGDVEVAPIHPFVLEQRVSATDAIREGLYVFDPLALGPQCKAVKLGLVSEKAPTKEEMRVVDPAILQQIWRDATLR